MSRKVFVLNGVEYGFMGRVHKCRVLSVEPYIDSEGCCFLTVSAYPDGEREDYFLDCPPQNLFYATASTERDWVARVFFRRSDAIRFVRDERRKWRSYCSYIEREPIEPVDDDPFGDELPF